MSLTDKSTLAPRILNFNSKDRVSGSNSTFTSINSLQFNYGYDSVMLYQASIPRSFYNVPTLYNSFQLKEGATTVTVTIPAGTYNRVNLQTVLQSRLNTLSPNGWIYIISYPNTVSQADTYKYTFTVSGNSSQPSFIFDADSVFKQLGFDVGTSTFNSNTLTSTNCINLASVTRCFIKSNICLDAQDSILQEILGYGSYPMLSLCYFEQTISDLNSRTLDQTAMSYQFSLVDSFGKEIDLNGVPYSFSLIFYKRNDIHEIQKQDMRFNTELRSLSLQERQTALERAEKDIEDGTANLASLGNLSDMLKPLYPVNPVSLIDLFK